MVRAIGLSPMRVAIVSNFAPVAAVCLAFFSASCSTMIESRHGFEKAQWAPAVAGRQCGPALLNETEIRPLKDPVFAYGRVSFRRVGVRGGPIYEFGDGASLQYEGKSYALRALRVIAPSEHRVMGTAFLLELQLYHVTADGEPLAVAIFVHKGDARPTLAALFNESGGELDAAQLLPQYGGHYVYDGAVLDGSCRGVRWVVMKSAIAASAEDVDQYLNRWHMAPRETVTLPAKRIGESE